MKNEITIDHFKAASNVVQAYWSKFVLAYGREEERKAQRDFDAICDTCKRAGWNITIKGPLAILIDPSGHFVNYAH